MRYLCLKLNSFKSKSNIRTTTFILIGIVFLMFSCYKEVKINFSYTWMPLKTNLANNDTICFWFNGGYNNDKVKVYLNGNLIYNKILVKRIPDSGYLEFKKGKINRIRFEINNFRSVEFELDKRYNYMIIDWDSYKPEIYFEYWSEMPRLD